MGSLTDSLIEEIARLEARLRADPTFQKLETARTLLRLYTGAVAVPAQVPAEQLTAAAPARDYDRTPKGSAKRVKRSAYDLGGMSGEAARAAIDILRARNGEPLPTADLLEAIAKRGYVFGGTAPQNSLSSLLSKTREIQAGRGGWILATVANELADNADPGEETLSANEPLSAPVEPGGEVAHEKIGLF